ncbi:hypothetical protein LCGC14_1717910 [marine sediment metagenome]|uniref:Uncharacterized protein n=1 Tax=marine sediment metagenome TaxID=412755 RepID=A0A0F9I0Y4_9ZZZZ
MKEAVLITYKGSSRTRIVPQAHIRATVIRMYHQKQEEMIIKCLGTMHKSPITDGPEAHWYERGSSDIRCWKRCNKRAHRGWQRHPKRIECKRRGRYRRYRQQYYPSIRLLNEQGLCVYPSVSG